MNFQFSEKTKNIWTENIKQHRDERISQRSLEAEINFVIAQEQWINKGIIENKLSLEKVEWKEAELLHIEHLPAIAIADANGQSKYHNAAFVKLFGYEVDEINQLGGLEKIFGNNSPLGNFATARTWQGTLNLNFSKKEKKHNLIFVAPLIDENNYFLGSIVTIVDISAKEKIEKKINKAQKELNKSLKEVQKMQEQLSILAKMLECLYSCPSKKEADHLLSYYLPQIFKDFSGHFMATNQQKTTERIVSWPKFDCGINPDNLYQNCAILRANIDVKTCFCTSVIAGGQEIGILYIQAAKKPILSHQQRELAMTISKHIGVAFSNIQEKENLQQQCVKDPLTGLYNRRHLEELIQKEMTYSARVGRPLTVFLLDIDHFKKINDNYGHGVGDLVLQTLGNFLKDNIRQKDYAYRYGGEEFLLVCPEMSAEQAKQVGENLREGVKNLHFYPEKASITISIGIATFPNHAVSANSLINRADQALYRAKELGRDRVQTFS